MPKKKSNTQYRNALRLPKPEKCYLPISTEVIKTSEDQTPHSSSKETGVLEGAFAKNQTDAGCSIAHKLEVRISKLETDTKYFGFRYLNFGFLF